MHVGAGIDEPLGDGDSVAVVEPPVHHVGKRRPSAHGAGGRRQRRRLRELLLHFRDVAHGGRREDVFARELRMAGGQPTGRTDVSPAVRQDHRQPIGASLTVHGQIGEMLE